MKTNNSWLWELFSYTDWLKAILHVTYIPDEVQNKYFDILHSIPYRYSLAIDSNRYTDGIDLRHRYMRESVIPDVFYVDGPCSVLEMLAAMAIKCSEEVMGGDSPGYYFWDFVQNLSPGLTDDEGTIRDKVEVWLSRNFDKRGIGSPFPLRKMRDVYDQRLVNSWDQMCGYLSENLVGLE